MTDKDTEKYVATLKSWIRYHQEEIQLYEKELKELQKEPQK